MKNAVNKAILTGFLAFSGLSACFTQNTPDVSTQQNSVDSTFAQNFKHQATIWCTQRLNAEQFSPTLAFINVVKDKRLKGFGVQTLVATKPFNIGTENPIIPKVGVGPHWGNKDANINAIAMFNTNSGFEGLKFLGNKNITDKFAVRGIADFSDEGKFQQASVNFIDKITKNLHLTAGGGMTKDVDVTIDVGMQYVF